MICHIEKDIPLEVKGDSVRLRQILTNLVGNAVKFTDSGEIVIRVQREPKAKDIDKCCLRFTVSDTGIGIPKNKMHRLFRSFSQVDGTNTRKYGGTGLGLAISKQLVEMMGGDIWFESNEGIGSTFYFTVCFSTQPDGNAVVQEPPAILQGVRVLVIDDNKTNQTALHEILTGWGMEVTMTDTMQDGIAIVKGMSEQGRELCFILIDSLISQSESIQAASVLRLTCSSCESKLIYMVTSNDVQGYSVRNQNCGAVAYLNKPVRHSELMNLIVNSLTMKIRLNSHNLSAHEVLSIQNSKQTSPVFKDVKDITCRR